MDKKISCFDLRSQPKKFLEGDWKKIIEKQISLLKENGMNQLFCIIHEKNKEDFVKLLDLIGESYKFSGYTCEWKNIDEDCMTPEGEIYMIEF